MPPNVTTIARLQPSRRSAEIPPLTALLIVMLPERQTVRTHVTKLFEPVIANTEKGRAIVGMDNAKCSMASAQCVNAAVAAAVATVRAAANGDAPTPRAVHAMSTAESVAEALSKALSDNPIERPAWGGIRRLRTT